MEVRLSKLMSERGLCSRKEADRFIEAGEVLVDGEVVSTLGTKVSPNSKISLTSSGRRKQSRKVTILFHKPIGVVSTQPEDGYREALEFIDSDSQWKKDPIRRGDIGRKRLSVVGRLDIDSKGLLILTEDGVLAKKIIGENSEIEKEYLVRVEGRMSEDKLKKLTQGLSLDGKVLKKAKIEHLGDNLYRFVLKEGRKRQIRRMCELVDLKVVGLKRVRIGNIRLGELPLGRWQYLPENVHV